MSQNLIASRRNVVTAGAALAALPLVGWAGKAEAAEMTAPSPPFALQSAADWQKQIGWRFAVHGERGRVPMRLVAVSEIAEKGTRPAGVVRGSSFVAIFEADRGTSPSGNALYKVSHPLLGKTDLFLTRAADENGNARISAAFS